MLDFDEMYRMIDDQSSHKSSKKNKKSKLNTKKLLWVGIYLVLSGIIINIYLIYKLIVLIISL